MKGTCVAIGGSDFGVEAIVVVLILVVIAMFLLSELGGIGVVTQHYERVPGA